MERQIIPGSIFLFDTQSVTQPRNQIMKLLRLSNFTDSECHKCESPTFMYEVVRMVLQQKWRGAESKESYRKGSINILFA